MKATFICIHARFLKLALILMAAMSMLALDVTKPSGDFIRETWSVDDGLPQSTVRYCKGGMSAPAIWRARKQSLN
jgi:hypothetical protein